MPGTGVRISGAYDSFLRITDKLGIAIAPAWNAQDLVGDEHSLYVGRPGTVGDRAGNFAVQNADCLLVLGCKLNIRQISYNFASFARAAKKIMVDVDAAELSEKTGYKVTRRVETPNDSGFSQPGKTGSDFRFPSKNRETPHGAEFPENPNDSGFSAEDLAPDALALIDKLRAAEGEEFSLALDDLNQAWPQLAGRVMAGLDAGESLAAVLAEALKPELPA